MIWPLRLSGGLQSDSTWPIRVTMALIALSLGIGCGGRSTSDYVPESSQARQAVEQMLAAWTRGETGKPEFQLANQGTRVQVFDKQWAGKKLTKGEIVRELPAEQNGPRQLAVKLVFEGDSKEIEATYYVVGIEPLLIFRDSEYNQASGMN